MQEKQTTDLKQVGKFVINLGEVLGEGSFGKVYAGFDSEEPEKKLAVKVLSMGKLAESEHQEDSIRFLKREIKILKSLKSDYIAQMYDIIRTPRNLYMFLRYANGGDLAGYLKKQKHKRLPESEAIVIAAQIVEGYKSLFKKNIIHRDIKPANILLDNGVALLTDFGLGKIQDNADDSSNSKMTVQGTPYYRSPQLLIEDQSHVSATNKCDVWSLGTVLYEIIQGQRPWDAQNIADYNKEITTKPLKYNVEVSEPVKNLINGMLQIEESQRFRWEDVFSHPAIKAVKL